MKALFKSAVTLAFITFVCVVIAILLHAMQKIFITSWYVQNTHVLIGLFSAVFNAGYLAGQSPASTAPERENHRRRVERFSDAGAILPAITGRAWVGGWLACRAGNAGTGAEPRACAVGRNHGTTDAERTRLPDKTLPDTESKQNCLSTLQARVCLLSGAFSVCGALPRGVPRAQPASLSQGCIRTNRRHDRIFEQTAPDGGRAQTGQRVERGIEPISNGDYAHARHPARGSERRGINASLR